MSSGSPTGEEAPRAAASQPPGAGGRKRPAGLVPVRVWSEADEVRILEGLAAYAAEHGAPPARSQLHAALEGRRLDKAKFTVTEIYEKVRRLRTKYCNLRAAGGPPEPDGGGGDGGDERRKYELSAAIWGDQPANVAKKQGGTGVDAGQPKARAISTGVRRGFEELQGLFPFLAMEVGKIADDEELAPVLKRAFEFIDDQEAGRLDAKAKRQKLEEARMATKVTALRNEVLKTLISFSGET
ncbi:hypothetical protein HU200_065270 [Digitaria exilis]|uniref:Glabrous enhancer-binding protein-like DBD domain-containing protein n=1 Tax=Digitaria exilis TaxID=1010633 RepID=A0A835DV36_9POAL|nr:hypothetical protein HU200_065270 [Digitaria exilis]